MKCCNNLLRQYLVEKQHKPCKLSNLLAKEISNNNIKT